MLTVIADALNIAARRRRDPLPQQDWADRFVPPSRRDDQESVRQRMRWFL